MELKQNFQVIKRGEKYWWSDLGDTTTIGYHAMVVVGFDDGKEAFEIMNSWGTSWGNDGFIWVKYDDFARYCRYAFQLSNSKRIIKERGLTGTFDLRFPQSMDEYGQVNFKNIPVFFNVYITNQWIRGH